jgi:chemotaxis protein methyltransferase WspC
MPKMDASLDKLKQILKLHIGLDASTVGDATIRKILNQRMRACKKNTLDDYYEYLNTHREELSDLLETAVIPETWFFRDHRPFGFILDRLHKHASRYKDNPCNILSIPCATGEEPYSLAMYLLDAGIPATAFRIQAVDISQRALDIASHGYYGTNSFRGKTDKKYVENYFTRDKEYFVIHESVRQCINFCRVNILDSSNLPYVDFFDFILCRNLLIYFDANTKKIAFDNLHRCLKNNGTLFIGHSEFGAVPRQMFFNTGADNCFGLIKQSQKPAKTEIIPVTKHSETPASVKPVVQNKTAAPAKKPFANIPKQAAAPASTAVPADASKDDLLSRARNLADQGKLNEAEEQCYLHIDRHGDSAESCFLLGLISEAENNSDTAENFLRKAIYLDPKHYQSLVHLALLLEQRGDHKGAKLMQQRASRALKN